LKAKKNIIFNALLLSAFFLIRLHAFGQGNILELLPGSERMTYNKTIGAHSLAGNVIFTYQGNTMYCDSALYYDKQNKVRAFGNVHISKPGEINLFCDYLTYDGKTELAFLSGNVRARDQEYKITTPAMEYDARAGRATYRSGGKVESIAGNEVLTSTVGYFYPDTKDFFFKGKVNYSSPTVRMTTDTLQYSYFRRRVNFFGPTTIYSDSTIITCEKGWYRTDTEESELMKNASVTQGAQLIKGDTLYYQPQQELVIGKGNVFLRDTSEKFQFQGDYLYKNDKTNKSYLTGHALAIKADKKDSLYLHADTLFTVGDSLDDVARIKAYNGVKIFQNKLQGQCDSLIFDKNKDILEMYQGPILWADKGELKGDTMFAFMNDSVIERAEVYENASALFLVDTAKYFNQVAGRKMTAYLKNNEITKAEVNGNAQTIYYPQEEQETDSTLTLKHSGMNRIYASALRVYLDSGEVVGITYFDLPEGVFYPIDQILKEEQFIPGFRWNVGLKPKHWREILE
jgi:lipopolysaccharide export system protein LptA